MSWRPKKGDFVRLTSDAMRSFGNERALGGVFMISMKRRSKHQFKQNVNIENLDGTVPRNLTNGTIHRSHLELDPFMNACKAAMDRADE